MVGQSLLVRLNQQGYMAQGACNVHAFSRTPGAHISQGGVRWWGLRAIVQQQPTGPVTQWICLAPIWTLHEHFDLMQRSGARRIVALSSTSRFTKQFGASSDDPGEHALAQKLAASETQFTQWAEEHNIDWVILRPTLIYSLGRDKNLTEIARFIRRFRFFPVLGAASGLRQPIHVDDVADASIAAVGSKAAARREYNISGAEILTYKEMVTRVFLAQNVRPRFIAVPMLGFRLAVTTARFFRRYRSWSFAMAERMNRDLVFDHSNATHDFHFSPRPFKVDVADSNAKPFRG